MKKHQEHAKKENKAERKNEKQDEKGKSLKQLKGIYDKAMKGKI